MTIPPKWKNARRNARRKRLVRLALMLAVFALLCTGVVFLVKAAAERRKPAAPEGPALPEIGVKLRGSDEEGLPVIGAPDVRNAAKPAENPAETKESRPPETREESTAPAVSEPDPSTEEVLQTTEAETAAAPQTTEAPPVTESAEPAAPPVPPTPPTQPPTQPTSPPTQPTSPPTQPPPPSTTAEAPPPSETQTSGETLTPPVNVNSLRVWIGDSRTRGLKLYAGADTAKDVFICEDGTGADWFERTAVPQLEALIAEKTVSAVYVHMGINDCAATYKTAEENRSARYSRDINSLISRYPQIRFFFLSVGPGEGETYFSTDIPKMNAEANAFNAGMKARCLADYVPVAEFLKSDGFKTMDGMHYDAATCKKIYAYVLRMTQP